jgi:long-chain acyl-CoA synthetase
MNTGDNLRTATMNAAEFVLADKPSDRAAIRTVKRDFTYGELDVAMRRVASSLMEARGRKGDRVILLGTNSFNWIAGYLGILRAGLVCVPLPARISALELRYVLENTEAKFAFVQTQLGSAHAFALASALVRTLDDCKPETYGDDGNAGTGQILSARPPEVTSRDLAALMFTSGSTGKPRGVMVSHGNIVANAASIIQSLELREDDRVMTVLPFHYCFGTSLLHTYLRVGGMLVIDTRFTYPEVVLNRMQETECTSFAGVPSHYQILLRNSSFARRDFPHLRSLLQAGGHLAPSFVRQLQEAFRHTRIFLMYGQTEATARLACLPPEFLSVKPGSIGKAIPGVTLRVLTESGEEAAADEVGEIVAEGENIAQGYWRSPEETALSFRNGRLYTGDLAMRDQDGFLYVVDRAKEFIKCGGTRISCRQLEDRILECEDILEVAVVGVPDDVLGEAVRAFVVPRQNEVRGLEERLCAFCNANLAPQLIPRDITVIDALPKNSSGKVLRPQLKAWQRAESAQEAATARP